MHTFYSSSVHSASFASFGDNGFQRSCIRPCVSQSQLCILCISCKHSNPLNAELFLSASDSRPMYQQLVDQITAKVMAGDWAAGQSLPSIRELAVASRVSVITVRRAYEELERVGVIATRQGRGSVVADHNELPALLMRHELLRQIDALLACAARLGLPHGELHRLIDQATNPEATHTEALGTAPHAAEKGTAT